MAHLKGEHFLSLLLFLFSMPFVLPAPSVVPLSLSLFSTPTTGDTLLTTVNVSIGTPSRQYTLGLDGGYTWIQVNSPLCTESLCGSGPTYDPSSSSTSVQTNISFESKYGFGLFAVEGVIVDDVWVYDSSTLFLQQQQFVSADSYRSKIPFNGSSLLSSGGLGFAYSTENSSFLSSLFNAHQISQNVRNTSFCRFPFL
jgi:hypothetical protein